nr:TM2 domain-containing protein [Dermacoccus nishinomiyaensis]
MTGEPLSDKSKIAAGLLQLFFGYFGVGRFYIGDTRTGGIQLALGLIGLFGTLILVGFPILVGVSIWAFIDAILMLTGSVRDPYGRKLN